MKTDNRPAEDRAAILKAMKTAQMSVSDMAAACGRNEEAVRAFITGDIDHPDHNRIWYGFISSGCRYKDLKWDDPETLKEVKNEAP